MINWYVGYKKDGTAVVFQYDHDPDDSDKLPYVKCVGPFENRIGADFLAERPKEKPERYYLVWDSLCSEYVGSYKRKYNAERRRKSEIKRRNLLDTAIVVFPEPLTSFGVIRRKKRLGL